MKRAACVVNLLGMRLLYCYDASLKLTGVIGPSGESVAIDSVSTPATVDGTTGKSTTIPVGQSPTGVAVDPSTHFAYVTDHDTKKVLVIRTTE